MRKAKPKKRILLPDPKFNDVLVTRFVNNFIFLFKQVQRLTNRGAAYPHRNRQLVFCGNAGVRRVFPILYPIP